MEDSRTPSAKFNRTSVTIRRSKSTGEQQRKLRLASQCFQAAIDRIFLIWIALRNAAVMGIYESARAMMLAALVKFDAIFY